MYLGNRDRFHYWKNPLLFVKTKEDGTFEVKEELSEEEEKQIQQRFEDICRDPLKDIEKWLEKAHGQIKVIERDLTPLPIKKKGKKKNWRNKNPLRKSKN